MPGRCLKAFQILTHLTGGQDLGHPANSARLRGQDSPKKPAHWWDPCPGPHHILSLLPLTSHLSPLTSLPASDRMIHPGKALLVRLLRKLRGGA